MSRRYVIVAAAALGAAQSVRAAVFAPYLSGSYTQGTIYNSDGSVDSYDMGFNNPVVVGDPTSGPTAGLTDLDFGFPEIISPFDPPADADQIVTVGYGGQITLKFPQSIKAQNSAPTLGVFTAVGLIDSQYPDGVATDPAQVFGTESAFVSVSADGHTWVSLGLQNLNNPQNYYTNATSPYQLPAPSPADIADFGQPFTGSLSSFDGEGFSQILTTLNGSAGGTWLDLSGTGLSQINYIQFSEPTGQVPDTSFVALEAVSANDASVPEPGSAIALLALSGLCFRRVRRRAASLAILISCLVLTLASATKAGPVDSIQFFDGNALNIQGTYGSGADSAYLVVDFASGPDYAWQLNWNPSTSVNGWQLMQDIAGQSILSTSGTPGTTTVSNPAGDPNLTLTAEFFSSFNEHQILNMKYGSTSGVNDWDFDTGTYNPANLSAADPQGITWKSSGVGIDAINLSNNEFVGWVDVFPHPPTPVAPEAPVPEPASGVMLLISAGLLLRRRSYFAISLARARTSSMVPV
jgi:hypothetical protein